MDKKEKIMTFQNELKWIKDKQLRKQTIEIIGELPDYFFTVPASSTGKYHPSYSLGEGGLVRHTKSAVLFAHTILELEQNQYDYDNDEQDIIIISLLLHDGVKQGVDNSEGYTRTTHPTDMAYFVSKFIMDKYDKLSWQWQTISNCIASHMGEWNKDYKTGTEVLPKPETKLEKFVHMCDYLASRKFIEIEFDKVEY